MGTIPCCHGLFPLARDAFRLNFCDALLFPPAEGVTRLAMIFLGVRLSFFFSASTCENPE